MDLKLSLSREQILNLIDLVEAYARRHNELLPPNENGIDLAEYVRSGDFARTNTIRAEMPERQAFLAALESLPQEQMRELQGIMYLGRGDFDAKSFWVNTRGLHMDSDPKIEVSHVGSKWAPLEKYLREGLAKAEAEDLLA